MISRTRRGTLVAAFAMLVALPSVLLAADRSIKNLRKPTTVDRTVDLFAAIESKEIDVKLIPKDETESRVLIRNNTNKPLNVKLPEVFAGVPVLAQVGGGGRSGGTNSGQQSMGGGMGMGMGMGGMGGMGGGGGMFNVAPEQVGQFKVATVCLEHGKKEPRPNIPYEIRPLAEVTTNPGVKELLAALGHKNLSQRATQAAAWHLANGLTWQQLASKRVKHLNGTSEPWFSPQEIAAGMQFAHAAVVEAEKNPPESPGQGESLSQAVISVD
jgi:hypothetical protein